MAKSKSKYPKGQALKAIRSDLAKLKAKGLWSGDARSAKGGWRQKALIKELRDVIDGKAAVVKVPRKDAAEIRKTQRVHNNRAVIRKRDKKERISYSEKSKTFTSSVNIYGYEWKRIILGKTFTDPTQLPRAPKGWVYRYGFVDGEGVVQLMRDYDDLIDFFSGYREKLKPKQYETKMRSVMPHIQIYGRKLRKGETPEEIEEGEEI